MLCGVYRLSCNSTASPVKSPFFLADLALMSLTEDLMRLGGSGGGAGASCSSAKS